MKIIRYSQTAWIRARSAEGASWAAIAASVTSSSAAGVPTALLGSPFEKPIDALRRAGREVAFEHVPRSGEPRAAMKMGDGRKRPGPRLRRLERLPGPLRVMRHAEERCSHPGLRHLESLKLSWREVASCSSRTAIRPVPRNRRSAEAGVDKCLGFLLGLSAAQHELHGQPAPIELEQAGQLGAVGLEHGGLGRLALHLPRESAVCKSLIRARARPALVLKMKYLPHLRSRRTDVVPRVGRGRRGIRGLGNHVARASPA